MLDQGRAASSLGVELSSWLIGSHLHTLPSRGLFSVYMWRESVNPLVSSYKNADPLGSGLHPHLTSGPSAENTLRRVP